VDDDDLVFEAEVRALTGLTPRTRRCYESTGDFPAHINLIERIGKPCAWKRSDVLAWCAKAREPKRRGRPRTNLSYSEAELDKMDRAFVEAMLSAIERGEELRCYVCFDSGRNANANRRLPAAGLI
jgi:predicted DNA-binding transcriptional regulator AlpA